MNLFSPPVQEIQVADILREKLIGWRQFQNKSCGSGGFFRKSEQPHLDLLDPVFLHPADGEAYAVGLALVALLGDPLQQVQQEAGQGVDMLLGQGQAEAAVNVAQGRAAVDHEHARLEGPDQGVLEIVFVLDLADDLLDDVLEGDDALDAAVFVHDNREVDLLAAEGLQQRFHRLGFRHEIGRPRDVAHGEGLRLADETQNFLDMNNADDLVEVAVINRKAGMAGLGADLDQLTERGIDSDADDLGARHHDIAHPDLGQVENAVQHASLVFGHHAGGFAELDHGAYLVLGDNRPHLFAAQQAGQQTHDPGHQPVDRRQQPHRQANRQQDPKGEFLRILGGVGFRADFGENQQHRRQDQD